jgi:integrase
MKRRLPPNVSRFEDRHGKERFRWRYKGCSAYLPGHPDLPESKALLDQLQAEKDSPRPVNCAAPGSVDDVLARFYRSSGFLGAGSDRQKRVRGILEGFRAKFGADQVSEFEWDIIEEILQQEGTKRLVGKRKVGGPVAAHNLHKQLKRFFDFAIKCKLISVNPARLAGGVKQVKRGFHTWTEEEIAQYRARWPLGTSARLWVEIILWTWQRKGDAHRFGPQHMKGERIQYTQAKGGKVLWLPAAPQLVAAIKAMPAIGMTTFLVTEYGKPFSKAGIGNKMREWCDAAGLPHCSSHGLRKTAARRAGDLGASNLMLKAAGGWSQDQEVATYTAAADQARLAAEIIMRVSEWELSNLLV